MITVATSISAFWRKVSAGRLHRRLVARGKGAQRVLDAIAELAGDLVGDVDRVLGNEIDADALRADEPHDLLDLFQQGRGGIVEQQMRLVEEESELGLSTSPHFGQQFEQFAQQPQKEGRI